MTRREYIRIINRTYIKEDTQCWVWCGVRKKNYTGYGMANFRGLVKPVHRTIYQGVKENIPEGLFVDHICFNKECVNPSHLQVLTNRENLLRSSNTLPAIQVLRTHCPYGHKYSKANTVLYGRKRQCRECGRKRQRDYIAINRDIERERSKKNYLVKKSIKKLKIAIKEFKNANK